MAENTGDLQNVKEMAANTGDLQNVKEMADDSEGFDSAGSDTESFADAMENLAECCLKEVEHSQQTANTTSKLSTYCQGDPVTDRTNMEEKEISNLAEEIKQGRLLECEHDNSSESSQDSQVGSDTECANTAREPNDSTEALGAETNKVVTGDETNHREDMREMEDGAEGGVGSADEEDDDVEMTEEMKKEVKEEEDQRMAREAEMTEEQLQDLYERANSMKADGNGKFKEGEYKEAIVLYSDALLACPMKFVKERSIMFSNRAACKLHLEQNKAAIEDCSRAIELNPNYLKAILRRAELYEKTEKLDEALEDYQRVLEMDPSLHVARQACLRLPDQIKERNEKMKDEMLGKLKDLGNMILRPFGLSTGNFAFTQDPNTGGYSVNFNQNPPDNNQ